MEGVEGQPPSKRVKVSSGETSGIMDRPPEAEGGNEFIGPKGIIRKVEFVRIIAKALQSLGYKNTGKLLEGESGIHLHTPAVTSLVEQVLAGNWDQSLVTLREIGLLDEEMIKRASVMIFERRFFELLDEGRIGDAMMALKSERVRLSISDDRVKELSICSVYPERCHLVGPYGKDTPKQKLRSELLVKLQWGFPPSVLIAEDRLLHLVEQTMDSQRDTFLLHDCGVEEMSLLADHPCGTDKLPKHTSQILWEHTNEVWFLQFSDDGKYLASGSKDCTVIVWEVKVDGRVVFKHRLEGHRSPVSFISWSPNSKQLLSCGVEEVVRRWDVDTGQGICIYRITNAGMVSCGWAPNGGSMYGITNDRSIFRWGLQGTLLQRRDQLCTNVITDLAILNNEGLVLAQSKGNTVVLVDLQNPVEPNSNPRIFIRVSHPIVSFSLSKDKKFALLNLLDEGILLWGTDHGFARLLGRYRGHRHKRCVVRSCFGGVNQAFVASGSEDSQVYIWHRDSTKLMRKLDGHTSTVNSVSWNPVNPHMLASASDDGTIRIWGLKNTEQEIGTICKSQDKAKATATEEPLSKK